MGSLWLWSLAETRTICRSVFFSSHNMPQALKSTNAYGAIHRNCYNAFRILKIAPWDVLPCSMRRYSTNSTNLVSLYNAATRVIFRNQWQTQWEHSLLWQIFSNFMARGIVSNYGAMRNTVRLGGIRRSGGTWQCEFWHANMCIIAHWHAHIWYWLTCMSTAC